MYHKSPVQCELLFSSSGYIVSKTHLSLEANTVNMLVCMALHAHSWFSVDILSEKMLVPFTILN